MFDDIDEDFEIICKKNKINWFDIKKENKNSLLKIGKKNGKPFYFQKMISMANIDFEILLKYSENDTNFCIEKYQNIIIKEEYSVWKEILLLQMIEKYHKDNNSILFIHFYTSFIRNVDGVPFMNFIFDLLLLKISKKYYGNNSH